jgi:hypothetical protein
MQVFGYVKRVPGAEHSPKNGIKPWHFEFNGQVIAITDPDTGKPVPLPFAQLQVARNYFTTRNANEESVCLVEIEEFQAEEMMVPAGQAGKVPCNRCGELVALGRLSEHIEHHLRQEKTVTGLADQVKAGQMNLGHLNTDGLKALLAFHQIEAPPKAKREDLVALVEESLKAHETPDGEGGEGGDDDAG